MIPSVHSNLPDAQSDTLIAPPLSSPYPPFRARALNSTDSALERVEALFALHGLVLPSGYKEGIPNYRVSFNAVHDLYAQQLKENVPIQKVVRFLTGAYKKILSSLVLDAQKILGPPPTSWVCIGMGSMAHDEMCPYSSFKFAFIIEENTEKTLPYFQMLTQLLELKTNPNNLKKWNFIDTPAGLVRLHREESELDVTKALSSVCYIAGDKRLLIAYERAQQAHFDEIDGVLTPDDFFLLSKNNFQEKFALKLIAESLQTFKPVLFEERQEICAFDIKKELYHPLHSLLRGIAHFYEIKPGSCFTFIEQLLQKNVFSPVGARNLDKAFQQLFTLRFEAHLFYQASDLFLLQLKEGTSHEAHYLYLDQYLPTLIEIYKVLVPFQRCGKEFLKTKDPKIFQEAPFYEDFVPGIAFEKTYQYEKAQNAYQQTIEHNPQDMHAHLRMGALEVKGGKHKEALQRYLTALSLVEPKNPLYKVHCNYNIGSIYETLGEYKKAFESYQKVLKILLKLEAKNHPHIEIVLKRLVTCAHLIPFTQDTLLGISSACFEIGMEHPLLQQFFQSLEERDSTIATSYTYVGRFYDHLGVYKTAIEFYHKALKTTLKFKTENHPDIATNYNYLGFAYENLKEFDNALKCFQGALRIIEHYFGKNHQVLIQAHKNIQDIIHQQTQSASALEKNTFLT